MRILSLHDRHLSFPDIDGFWDTQNLVETERRIRAELPHGTESVSAEQVEALTQAARVFCLQGKMKEARDFLVYAESILNVLPPSESTRARIRYHLEEGRFFCLSMYPARALDSFRSAWEMASNVDRYEFFAIDAAHMISITLPAKQGKEWLQKAVQIAEKSESSFSKKWLPYLYMENGWQAFDRHDFESALEFFEKADSKNMEKYNSVERTLKWCKARSLRALKKLNEAIDIQKDLLNELSKIGESNGHVSLELAECYKLLSEDEKAANYYKTAYDQLKTDKWYSENCEQELSEMQKKLPKKKKLQQ